MIKKTVLIFCVLPVVFLSCLKKTNSIPEISPVIIAETIQIPLEIKKILHYYLADNKCYIIDSSGQYIAMNISDKKVALTEKIHDFSDRLFFAVNEIIYYCSPITDQIIQLNLESKDKITVLPAAAIEEIIYANHYQLIYKQDGKIKVIEMSSDAFQPVKMFSASDKIASVDWPYLILYTESHMILFNLNSKQEISVVLPKSSSSPPVIVRDYLYFGTTDRSFVKYSLKLKKIIWEFALPEKIKLTPLKIGHFIVVLAEDQNLYVFQRNGDLKWWINTGSSYLIKPVPMSENIAIFSKDNQIRFFNICQETLVSLVLSDSVKSLPKNYQANMYILNENMDSNSRFIEKVGNFKGIELNSNPPYLKVINQPIRFSIKPVNLIQPIFRIKVLSESTERLLEKSEKKESDFSISWTPAVAGSYHLELIISAENLQENIHMNHIFSVIDPTVLKQNYYFDMNHNCIRQEL